MTKKRERERERHIYIYVYIHTHSSIANPHPNILEGLAKLDGCQHDGHFKIESTPEKKDRCVACPALYV